MREQRFTHNWCETDLKRVERMLREGLSASEIAVHFDVSRNAICGLVWRVKSLAAIGFKRSPAKRGPEWAPKRSRKRRPKPQTAQIVKFPSATVSRPAATQPALRVVSNNTPLMVKDWMEANSPRRFERQDRTDPFTIKAFLEARGYKLSGGWQGHSTLKGPGVNKSHLPWAKVMEFVDAIRVREGLQPFKRKA